MRTCNELTRSQITAYGPENVKHPPLPAWCVSAVWDALHDRPISLERENKMRAALGLEPLPAMIEVPPCPDCGSAHTGRCNGKPVAEVIVKTARVVHPDVARMVRGLEIALERKAAR